MILGQCEVTTLAVETHKNSYRIAMISVASVDRPLLPAGLVSCLGAAGFAARFHDILYSHEIVTLIAATLAFAATSFVFGKMTFLSRDLKGMQQSTAIYGTYRHLNRLRREVMAARNALSDQVSS